MDATVFELWDTANNGIVAAFESLDDMRSYLCRALPYHDASWIEQLALAEDSDVEDAEIVVHARGSAILVMLSIDPAATGSSLARSA